MLCFSEIERLSKSDVGLILAITREAINYTNKQLLDGVSHVSFGG